MGAFTLHPSHFALFDRVHANFGARAHTSPYTASQTTRSLPSPPSTIPTPHTTHHSSRSLSTGAALIPFITFVWCATRQVSCAKQTSGPLYATERRLTGPDRLPNFPETRASAASITCLLLVARRQAAAVTQSTRVTRTSKRSTELRRAAGCETERALGHQDGDNDDDIPSTADQHQ